jgi:hypothetical protein
VPSKRVLRVKRRSNRNRRRRRRSRCVVTALDVCCLDADTGYVVIVIVRLDTVGSREL